MKFRSKQVGTKTINKAGGKAYKETTELELVSVLLTSFVNDKFYESKNEQLDRLSSLVASIADKKFAAKAAIYARNEFGMRSITHALAGELAYLVKGQEWVKNAIYRIVKRPDDMLEILGYYGNKYGKPFPNSLKKGLSKAVHKFSEYQLAKYRGETSDTKLVDLFNIVHPVPKTEAEKDVYARLMKGELKSNQTWEFKMTQAGQEVEDLQNEVEKSEKLSELKKEVWKEMLTEKKLGYFALLRNLRNIIKQAPEYLDIALGQLQDEESIKKSLVLPFRFDTAVKTLSEDGLTDRKVITALSNALDISLSNVPVYNGKTLIVVDVSGSMQGNPLRIASLFASILFRSNNDAEVMLFSNNAKYLSSLNPQDSTITIARNIVDASHPGGTNFHSIFLEANKAYDRVIILSDMQGWVGYDTPVRQFNGYCSKYKCNPFIYSFDLAGHGTLQMPQDKIFCIAGFSDKIFDAMKVMEQDKNALINEINKIEI